MVSHAVILDFWFGELTTEQWFTKDERLDQTIRDRFLTLHQSARQCELYAWREIAKGRLAEIIILDQFSRNIFRGSPLAFACDAQALTLAQEAVHAKADQELVASEKSFLYMPYMHSESVEIHEVALKLFNQPGLEYSLKYEQMHMDVIKRFGRYPHRNAVLGRNSTPEELKFLESNSGF